MCAHYRGRLPSEIAAEPLLPMLQTIALQEAAAAWSAFRKKPADVKTEDLQKSMPMMDAVIRHYAPVMAEVKRRRAAHRAKREW